MVTIKRLVQQIARIRFGRVVRFARTTVAALPVPAAGKDRFSVLGKVSPLARIIHIFEDNKGLLCYKHVV
jgi:hypothetical protein